MNLIINFLDLQDNGKGKTIWKSQNIPVCQTFVLLLFMIYDFFFFGSSRLGVATKDCPHQLSLSLASSQVTLTTIFMSSFIPSINLCLGLPLLIFLPGYSICSILLLT